MRNRIAWFSLGFLLLVILAAALSASFRVNPNALTKLAAAVAGVFFPGRGESNASPIADNRVVLVRKGTNQGAFVVRNQRGTAFDYDWCVFSEGMTTIDRASPLVQSGSATNITETNGLAFIAFGPFSIPWSQGGPGQGWLYYGRGTGVWDTEMAITPATNFTNANLADFQQLFSRWPLKAP